MAVDRGAEWCRACGAWAPGDRCLQCDARAAWSCPCAQLLLALAAMAAGALLALAFLAIVPGH